MSDECKGLTAIITGAGAGGARVSSVGEATAILLARRGAAVCIADVNEQAGEETAAAIQQRGGDAFVIAADLSQESSCRQVAEACSERWGRIDILVNNLGVTCGGVASLEDGDDWDKAIAINAKAPLYMFKAAFRLMSNGGSVVNVSTTAIETPSASAAYGASKAALEGLTYHIAQQYGPDRIRCNAVRPGEAWTAIVDRMQTDQSAAEKQRTAKRMRTALLQEGDAWDVAELIAFLAGPRSKWITGQVITVDGGGGLLRPSDQWSTHPSYWRAKG